MDAVVCEWSLCLLAFHASLALAVLFFAIFLLFPSMPGPAFETLTFAYSLASTANAWEVNEVCHGRKLGDRRRKKRSRGEKPGCHCRPSTSAGQHSQRRSHCWARLLGNGGANAIARHLAAAGRRINLNGLNHHVSRDPGQLTSE
jgi:hypothetical protein